MEGRKKTDTDANEEKEKHDFNGDGGKKKSDFAAVGRKENTDFHGNEWKEKDQFFIEMKTKNSIWTMSWRNKQGKRKNFIFKEVQNIEKNLNREEKRKEGDKKSKVLLWIRKKKA